jgi:ketosteroid isomerase-like protein
MSRENVEIVRRLYDAVARRDTGTVLTFYDPEIEWDMSRHPSADAMGRTIYRGHDGLRSWFRQWYEAWEEIEDECEELIDAGEHVISVVTTRGRGRASGVEVEAAHHAAVWTLREGKVVRVAWFRSVGEALEATGLDEHPRYRGNVEAARHVLAAVADRDLSRLLDLTDPEIEWQSFFALAERGEYHGHDALRRYVSDLSEAFEWIRPVAEDFLEVGNLVIGVGNISYRGKGSGVETESPSGWLFKFRDGKLLRFRAFRDPEQALDVVGRAE